MGLGADGGELRHDGVGVGLAGLALRGLDLGHFDEAFDLVGAQDRQHEGTIAIAVGFGHGGEPPRELASGRVVGLPERGAGGLAIRGQHLAAQVGEEMAVGLPVGHGGQAEGGEEPAEAGVEHLDDDAHGAGVAAARGHHGGGEGEVIRPGRAGAVAGEVADEALVHGGPGAGMERIAARLGRVQDLGGDPPRQALPGMGLGLSRHRARSRTDAGPSTPARPGPTPAG